MILLGKCEAQYANNLISARKIVLRTDRDSDDNPNVEIYKDDAVDSIIIRIINDVGIYEMNSNPKAGAKDRTDIHFNKNQIENIVSILKPYVDSLKIRFDDIPRSTPDPTGLEHPNGLSLGITYPITWVYGKLYANYAGYDFMVCSEGKIYIDAEKYYRGEKIHFGISMNNQFYNKVYDYNCFDLIINNDQLKRLLHSFVVAKKWFK